MIKKNLTRGLQFACALGVTAAAVATTFTTTNVVASASAPTGTCALVASQSSIGQGSSITNDTAAIIGTVTFNGPFAIDLQNLSSSGSSLSTVTSKASGTTEVGAVRASGAYPVTFTGTETDNAGGSETPLVGNFAFLPSNNNQTYLVTSMQGNQNNGGGAFSGVCQVQ